MNHASLAARYRPQSFAEVTGQDLVKTVLSRAAAQDRVAPAYLLSGTRGVGKTTIARIFAKALNCERAPTPEPCNQCEQCRRIVQGSHVDVVEIDGASNRGIEDARRLREAIAYAPMEGRYKVFIIDEAHMLTRESFNALLKTLEEPPPRATFILATTEAHKFPATIVSRCQHFAFRAIPEADLAAHLGRVLQKEGVSFEDTAVSLIARRAAGSVRDGMSLLGQVLALGGERLTEGTVRDILGLAGQELYESLLAAFRQEDCPAVARLVRELLERGVDLGFFLREFAQLWRNLFLIRQAGPAAAELLQVPEAERQRLVELAPGFDLTYIHAAWQMVLESQRQILTSIEPAAALELLLLNLALLPRLVSLEVLSGTASSSPRRTNEPGGSLPPPPRTPPPPASPPRPEKAAPQPASSPAPVPERTAPQTAPASPPVRPPHNAQPPEQEQPGQMEADTAATAPDSDADSTWQSFLGYCTEHADSALSLPALGQGKGVFDETGFTLATTSRFQYEQLTDTAALAALRRLVSGFRGQELDVRVQEPRLRKTEAELKQEMEKHETVRALAEAFDASLIRCIPVGDLPPPPPSRKRRGRRKWITQEGENNA